MAILLTETGYPTGGALTYEWFENESLVGTSDGLFSPETECSRAHIVSFLYRYLVEQN